MHTGVHIAQTSDHLSKDLAEYIANTSHKFISSKGKFTVAVSGGSLPSILGKFLLQEPFKSKIEWSKWQVFFADERVVPLDDPESNYRVCAQFLFSKVTIPDNHIHKIDPSMPLEEVAISYQKCIEQVCDIENGFPSFDLILLGMGPDGHTASLFPNHALLSENKAWVTYISNSPKPPPKRITLTLPVLNNAKQVAFVCTGEPKKDALAKILEGPNTNKNELPSSLVSPKSGDLKWFIDKEAAQGLKKSYL